MKGKKISVPAHVALIPDGNRRWARSHKLSLLQGYSLGIDKFIDFANWSKDFGVKTLTVWGLSTENLAGRTGLELKILFALYTRAACDKAIIKQLKDGRTRLKVIGDMASLPRKLSAALQKIEKETSHYRDYTINLLINYGGKEDLIYSVRELSRNAARNGGRIDEKAIRENLRTASIPDVDLVIRTSGEMRLSGMLPWQSTYSELYFAKKYWPDFSKRDFRQAIETFSKRQRRFGK